MLRLLLGSASIARTRVRFALGPHLPPVTVSIGIAEMQTGASPEGLIQAADAAVPRWVF